MRTAEPAFPTAPRARRRACVLFVDANVLLDQPELSHWRADWPELTIVVLERVVAELRGLARRQGDASAAAARRALLALEALRQRGPGAPVKRGAPRVQLRRGEDQAASVDAHLVAEAAAFARLDPGAAVAVVTRDVGVWERATRASVYCVLVRGRFDNAALERAVREALAAHEG